MEITLSRNKCDRRSQILFLTFLLFDCNVLHEGVFGRYQFDNSMWGVWQMESRDFLLLPDINQELFAVYEFLMMFYAHQ